DNDLASGDGPNQTQFSSSIRLNLFELSILVCKRLLDSCHTFALGEHAGDVAKRFVTRPSRIHPKKGVCHLGRDVGLRSQSVTSAQVDPRLRSLKQGERPTRVWRELGHASSS